MAQGLSIGDEVAIDATITKIIDGHASLSIPGYHYPHSIPAPPKAKAKAKAKDKIELIGEITRLDEESVTVGLSLGGLITLPPDKVRLVTAYKPPVRKTPLVDKTT